MFQSGVTTLTNGATTVEVVFPIAFGIEPDTVIPVVQNISADGTKYIIGANVIAKSISGFTAGFDSPLASGNYTLAWLAGGSADVLDIVSTLNGRKLTSFDPANTMLQAFKLPMVAMSPVPHIELVDQDLFFSSVVGQAANVPAGPLDGEREVLQLAVDDNWLYVGLPFPTPFASGVAPEVMVTLRNTLTGSGADASKEILSHQVVASSLSGFTIAFSSPPTAANMVVYYMARQLS
jgi:hypothetical protein